MLCLCNSPALSFLASLENGISTTQRALCHNLLFITDAESECQLLNQCWDQAKGQDCVYKHKSKRDLFFFLKVLICGGVKVPICELCSLHVRVVKQNRQVGKGSFPVEENPIKEQWAQAYSHCYSPRWEKMCFCQQGQTIPGSSLKSQANSHSLLASEITLLPVACIPLQRFPAAGFFPAHSHFSQSLCLQQLLS